uniref:EOG090X0EO1 n=1 Tax=Daphnia lumholtzi TaxID=42856 RepID=A0A4Y7MDQ5_9CRUS|nr:EOG090X0EO1 [Daphnia lumholtzi]SVE77896.1 EOG090X0EO1 [Daphnia lumholtzi]SVE78526.1 EOG090X0EO1 [Daphnia lumholtzi]SVE79155.1 EOG090X0EO1 [Daphnia lumholtzi]
MKNSDTEEVESLKNDILRGNLSIQNILHKIQNPDVTESDVVVLNSEYRSEFKQLKHCIDEFEKVAKDEDEDGELGEDVSLFRNQLTSLQSAFRKANVQCQLTVSMKNKAELFYSNPEENEIRSRQTKSKEELIKMSTNVTANLRNISQSMASVLEQNRGTLEVLAQSSNTVSDNQDEFKVMGSALITTKKLVSRFGRRETTDLILIILALAAFFAACVYVIQKRMF